MVSEPALLGWRHFHLGPMPGAREVRTACLSVLAASLVLTGVSIVYGSRGQTVFGHELGGDFAQFYVAGKILNEYPHDRVYDIQLQHRLQHELLPGWDPSATLVYASAPFLALLFQPLAELPYVWAYVMWLLFSCVLYVAGLILVWRRGDVFDGLRTTVLIIALSFFPFAFECWFGGQLSVVGFFALALCMKCRQLEQPVISGLALAACTYKPTLLAVILPMLFIGRRFRMLLGFSVGTLTLAGVSFLAVGYNGCAAYLETLRLYARVAAGDGSVQQLFKYVDINSFVRQLLGGGSPVSLVISLALSGVIFAYLAYAWWRSPAYNKTAADLLWAATIAWTLVLNAYVPIYDTILVVLSALLTAGVLRGAKQESWVRAELHNLHFLLLLLYVTACLTQYLVPLIRLQLMTLVLIALGLIELRLWRKATLDSFQSMRGGPAG